MSLNVRWLTNGKKEVYTVVNSSEKTFDVYSSIREIPVEIRHYADIIKKPTFCGPDLSRMFGVQEIFYPDFPKVCNHPDYIGKMCIAESCKYAEDDNWEKCPYFPKD